MPCTTCVSCPRICCGRSRAISGAAPRSGGRRWATGRTASSPGKPVKASSSPQTRPSSSAVPTSGDEAVRPDADAVEVLVTPDNVQRARADTALATYPYKGSAYGYVGFNLAAPGDSTKPHPLFGDRDLRRALVMATDRERVLRNVFGDLAKVPPGPLSQLWWIW